MHADQQEIKPRARLMRQRDRRSRASCRLIDHRKPIDRSINRSMAVDETHRPSISARDSSRFQSSGLVPLSCRTSSRRCCCVSSAYQSSCRPPRRPTVCRSWLRPDDDADRSTAVSPVAIRSTDVKIECGRSSLSLLISKHQQNTVYASPFSPPVFI
jgi:hypothetical protein